VGFIFIGYIDNHQDNIISSDFGRPSCQVGQWTKHAHRQEEVEDMTIQHVLLLLFEKHYLNICDNQLL
jgi:hypothetical protein